MNWIHSHSDVILLVISILASLGVGTIAGSMFTSWATTKREQASRRHDEKVAHYRRLADILLKNSGFTTKLQEELVDIYYESYLYSSAKTIRTFQELLHSLTEEESVDVQERRADLIKKMVLAMRRELFKDTGERSLLRSKDVKLVGVRRAKKK